MADDTNMAGLRASLVVAPDGRVVIPAAMRARLGLKDGGKLIARLDEDGVLVLETIHAAVARAQAMVRKYIPDTTGKLDEFIAERHAAARDE
jgi:antitoxin PrlF